MSLIPVEGHNGLYRDSNTNAIINKNRSEYESYKNRKKKLENEKNKILISTGDYEVLNLNNKMNITRAQSKKSIFGKILMVDSGTGE